MIRCSRLPPDDKLVFSDDRALVPDGFNAEIQAWLSSQNPRPNYVAREPERYDPEAYFNPNIDPSTLTVKTIYFHRQYWQLGGMRRVFMMAVCPDKKWEILGPEIDPRHGHVIAPSPVEEVIIKEQDQPPASIHHLGKRAAEVWATLSDEEREQRPRIGQVAECADLDTLL